MSRRDERLAREMAEKHGAEFESATTRAGRKAAEKHERKAAKATPAADMRSAADYVRTTPESAKRGASHRATARDPKDNGQVRSITRWWRS